MPVMLASASPLTQRVARHDDALSLGYAVIAPSAAVDDGDAEPGTSVAMAAAQPELQVVD